MQWKDQSTEKLNGKFAWVSDGYEKHLVTLYENNKDNYYIIVLSNHKLLEESVKYWLPIEQPELPKPKLHRCSSISTGHECFETILSLKLILRSYGNNLDCLVDYCPFCGYTSKKDS